MQKQSNKKSTFNYNPTQKDMIDDYCAFSTSKNDALEQLELLSQKSEITKEELNAFNRNSNKKLQPFIDKVKELFNAFSIDIDVEDYSKGELIITLMIPTPFPMEIGYCYNFNEDVNANVKYFKEEFKTYCECFSETSKILSNIKDTF